jgi:hypothetical protein
MHQRRNSSTKRAGNGLAKPLRSLAIWMGFAEIRGDVYHLDARAATRRCHLNMGCGTNAGAVSISPLNISAGL